MPGTAESKPHPPVSHQWPRSMLRRGPRPLLLHLGMAALRSSGLPPVWPNSSDDWLKLIAHVDLERLATSLQGPDAELVHGIAAYRRHPWTRDLHDPPVLWSEGETRLLDFGGESSAPPLLLVPSLINRATIMDLTHETSMARWLAEQGLRVFLLDWGWPECGPEAPDLDGLITGRLSGAMLAAAGAGSGAVTLAGYCMGGLLALAAALLNPGLIAGLAVLATPWDFHAGATAAAQDVARLLETLEPVMALTGTLPVDALQMLFNATDPHGVGDKYRAFGRMAPDSARALQFVALEDWLNDGIPLAASVARVCLKRWYGDNAPALGVWEVAGMPVRPEALAAPCFAAIPGRDRIVPPESAAALADALPNATIVRPAAGHVGMIAGQSAEVELWRPLAAWARERKVQR